MTYQLYDVDGYVADAATNTGVRDLRRWIAQVNEQDRTYLNLSSFLEAGAILLMQDLIDEIDRLPEPPTGELRRTVRELRVSLMKCDSVAILNAGIEE